MASSRSTPARLGAPGLINIHVFGGADGGPKDGVVGPGADHKGACDGKGIDYVEACFPDAEG